MVTLKEIAKKTGFAVSTVSTAINRPHKISQEVRQKIWSVARELGYFATKEISVKKILVVADTFEGFYYAEYYSDVILGVLQRLSELKKLILIRDDLEVDYSEIYDIDGIVFIGRTPDHFLKKAVEYKIPHILLGHPNPNFDNSSSIYNENIESVKMLMEYLISCGHRRFAYIYAEKGKEDIIGNNFSNSFKKTLLKRKIPADKKLFYFVDIYTELDSIAIAFNDILSQKPKVTAIVCANDLLAYRIYQLAEEHGIKIPQDISVTGYDCLNIPRYCRPYSPELTTVLVKRKEMAKQGVDLLMQLIKNPDKVPKTTLYPTKLIIRKSVRRV